MSRSHWEIHFQDEAVFHTDGKPSRFRSYKAAARALAEHHKDYEQAYRDGHIAYACDETEYEIVCITEINA